MANTFVIYTPIEEKAGLRSGGPLKVKTGSLSSAYVAFASDTLAQVFCARFNVGANARILDARSLGPEFPVPSSERTAVRFPDREALELYFGSPDTFPYEQHLVSLGASHAV